MGVFSIGFNAVVLLAALKPTISGILLLVSLFDLQLFLSGAKSSSS